MVLEQRATDDSTEKRADTQNHQAADALHDCSTRFRICKDSTPQR
jgi:hypothetical protein